MSISLIDTVIVALKKTLNLSETEIVLPTSQLKDDLGLDSMTSLTFLLALEDMVPGFTVDPEKLDMQDLHSVETVVDFIKRELDGDVAYA